MTIKISTLTLANGLRWTDRYSASRVQQSLQRTLGGRAHFYESPVYGAIPITLESIEDEGWQPLPVIEALYSLSVAPYSTYVLDFNGVEYSVRFRHEDPPALEVAPLVPREVPLVSDYFTVIIKLVTI
jgi:hypothetical protein